MGFLLVFSMVLFASGGKEEGAKTAEPRELIIISHRVHKAVATGENGKGRNMVAEFEDKFNAKVTFQTYPTNEVQDKLFRLGPLSKCDEDIIYVVPQWSSRQTAKFLTPMNDFMNKKPIENFETAYPPGMAKTWTYNGQLHAIAARAGTSSPFYNKRIFAERGVSRFPKTPEELLEAARKTTYTLPSGEKVFGFCVRGTKWEIAEKLPVFSRMWEGDVIDMDHKVVINEPPVIKALNLLRTMYSEGLMPPNWGTIDYAEIVKLTMEGRLAISMHGANYSPTLNNPEKSKEAGNLIPAHMPLAKEFQTAERDFGVSFVWFWAQAILNGSSDKDLAWDFIQFIGSKDARAELAKSGNAIAHIEVMQASTDPGIAIYRELAPFSRPAFPGMENYGEIAELVGDMVHKVVIQGQDAQATADAAKKQIEAVMKY
jgi:multiple sugar transport system substrate-binding protein